MLELEIAATEDASGDLKAMKPDARLAFTSFRRARVGATERPFYFSI